MTVCIHHWLVAPPDGPGGLPAVCRKCGARRVFAATNETNLANDPRANLERALARRSTPKRLAEEVE